MERGLIVLVGTIAHFLVGAMGVKFQREQLPRYGRDSSSGFFNSRSRA